MKIHKISLLAALAAAALALSPALQAQDTGAKKERPPGPPGAPGPRSDARKTRFNQMAEELKLTDAQKPKVEAALKEQVEKMGALTNVPPAERREKVQAVRADFDKKMKETLNAEQYEQWQQARDQRRPRGEKKAGEKKSGEKKAEQN